MNPLTLAAMGLIALILVVTAIRMVIAIGANFAVGRQVRANLRHRITRLRFGNMIARRGIDLDTYLHEVPMPALESQIRACENCDETGPCTRSKSKRDAEQGSDFDFCPNDAALSEYKMAESKVAKPLVKAP